MAHNTDLEALNKIMKDILENIRLMGRIVLELAGDS